MSGSALASTMAAMNTADEGAQIRARRTRIGMSVKALALRAGVDRGRLTAIENGAPARDSTIGAIERVLAELEHEMELAEPLPPGVTPIGDPAEGLVAIEVYTDDGVVRAIVKGPVRDAEIVRQTAANLIADMARPKTDTTP